VEILEDDHERPSLREHLEEASPGGEGLAAAVGAELVAALEAEERAEVTLKPLHVSASETSAAIAWRSFAAAPASSSVSSTPAWAFTISPSAQKLTPSP
jgi:hypothetical protein